jgi:hypothetical protein
MLLNFFRERIWINGADMEEHRLIAAFEEHDARDGRDVVLGCEFHVFVDVDFADFDFAGELIGDAIDDRRERTAGSAPGCPEVGDDERSASHIGVEVSFAVLDDIRAGHMAAPQSDWASSWHCR